MALVTKLLAVATPIVGGAVAIPLYLKSTGGGETVKLQKPTQDASENHRPAEKVECKASEVPKDSPNLVDFLHKKSKKEIDYSYVSCTNTEIKGDKASFLDRDWTGLFPKEALDEIFSPAGKDNFPMDIEITQEEGTGGSWYKSVFKNPQTNTYIEGKWGRFEDTNFGKKSVPVSIQSGSKKKGDIYIFTGKADTSESSDTTH